MKPHILSIATANPPHKCFQEELAKKMITMLSLEGDSAKTVQRIYNNSAIECRYSVIEDYTQNANLEFLGQDYPKNPPGMHKRNLLYKEKAPKLAHEAALKALEAWGGDRSEITHVISVSCTGVLAPGIEFLLIQSLNLKRTTHRLGINLMGCFGAFKGLQVAAAFAKENPKHRILLVCTELCSLHLQADNETETLLANSLFGDGIAAVVVGCEPRKNEKTLFSIEHQNSFALEDSLDKMTWEAGDHGFLMTLSSFVPVYIKKYAHFLVEPLLKGYAEIGDCDWAIHPGGKSILQAMERALKLKEEQVKASWEVLWNYGNMSSATFLFVLERLSRQPLEKHWTAGVGFGPGLSMEGILLKRMARHE